MAPSDEKNTQLDVPLPMLNVVGKFILIKIHRSQFSFPLKSPPNSLLMAYFNFYLKLRKF
jgi:hypothetical protein